MEPSRTRTETSALHALGAVLKEEEARYARLLELAREQGEKMCSHDIAGLQEVARRLSEGLAAADATRLRREALAREGMRPEVATPARSLSAWLDDQPAAVRGVLAEPVRSLQRTAGKLARANEGNRRLASFCLDLVEEEASLLRRCVLEDPAGCYDRGAQPTRKAQGGVLQRQA